MPTLSNVQCDKCGARVGLLVSNTNKCACGGTFRPIQEIKEFKTEVIDKQKVEETSMIAVEITRERIVKDQPTIFTTYHIEKDNIKHYYINIPDNELERRTIEHLTGIIIAFFQLCRINPLLIEAFFNKLKTHTINIFKKQKITY